MTIVEELQAVKAQLEAANQTISAFDGERAQHQAAVAELTSKLSEANKTTTEQVDKIAKLDADLKASTQLMSEVQAKLDAELAKEKNAKAEAAKIVAGLGIKVEDAPPVEASDNRADTAEELKQKFSAMKPGPERSAFYAKHKNILSK